MGIDVGTNSLGWAIVEVDDEGCTLLDRGVDIFQEGVAREKNQEKPAVQDRTDARALRRHYFRRRLRKIALLRVLVRHDLCPALSEEQLNAWQGKGFIRWTMRSSVGSVPTTMPDRNPYRDPLPVSDRRTRFGLPRRTLRAGQGAVSSVSAPRISEQSQGCGKRGRGG